MSQKSKKRKQDFTLASFLYEYIKKNPNCSYKELSRVFAVKYDTAVHICYYMKIKGIIKGYKPFIIKTAYTQYNKVRG